MNPKQSEQLQNEIPSPAEQVNTDSLEQEYRDLIEDALVRVPVTPYEPLKRALSIDGQNESETQLVVNRPIPLRWLV